MIETQRPTRTQLPIVLHADDFDPLLPPADVLAALRGAFEGLATGLSVQPPQTLSIFPRDMGDVIAYSGIVAAQNVFGTKLSPYFPGRKNGSKVTAWTILFSLATGDPVLICDSLALTTQRTAATTALALQLLLPKSARRLAVFGVGPVGRAHIRYAEAVHSWEQIVIYSRTAEKDRSALLQVASHFSPKVKVAGSGEEAVRTADAVLLCTSAATPVIDHRWLRPGQIVTSISTNALNAHEIAPEALPNLEVYCDYRATTPTVAGEMVQAAKQGWAPGQIRGDLPELITGRARLPSNDAPVFFRSVGLGIEDIAIANALLAATDQTIAATEAGSRQ